MFTKEMPKTISKMYDVVYNVEKTFEKDFSMEKESGQGEYSLFFKTRDGERFFFTGFKFSLYQCTQNWFWFGVDMCWNEPVVKTFSQRHENVFIRFDNFLLCPIPEETLEKENFLEKTTKIIGEELEALKAVLNQ
jgi:hypothetical protein